MTAPSSPPQPFRPVDPLIHDVPEHAPREPYRIPPTGFRPDIEGLRAIAVVLVVLFHADLGPFDGGFIGVDVFFVVSGFLITSLLLGEVSRTGAVSLSRFWARRARRLLPASCVVVVATLIAAQWLYDPLLLGRLSRDAIGASLFVVNIVFAVREANGDGGYFDADLSASPLLHFWSLAVEEQFYLVWPLLIAGLARTARRLQQELVLVIGVLWLLSLGASVLLTDSNPPWAFYSLPTRAWELLTGALLAVGITRLRMLPARLVLPLAATGLTMILVAAVTYGPSTPFPGVAAALPVLGTALVVAAGCSVAGAGRLRAGLGAAPLMWVGQRSYGIYLWHWPALVLIGSEWGPLNVVERLAVIAASVGVAAISYRVIEAPVRHSTWLASQPRRSLVTGASLLSVSALVAALLLAAPRSTDAGIDAATLTLPPVGDLANPAAGTAVPTAPAPGSTATTIPTSIAPASPTIAATTVATTTPPTPAPTPPPTPAVAPIDQLIAAQQQLLAVGLETDEVPANLRPSLNDVRGDLPAIYDEGCVLDPGVTDVPLCAYGVVDSPVSIAILGDSHAAHWFPALQEISLAQGWRLLVYSKKGCPPSEQPMRNDLADIECTPWRDAAIASIAAEQPRLIILTGYHYETQGGGRGNDIWQTGMTTVLTKLGGLAPRVLILGDTPTEQIDVPECLAGNLRSVRSCVSSREYAVRGERLQIEADLAAQFGAVAADTSNWLCTPEACPVIMGDLLVYRDRNHLTPDASRSLAPLLEATLVPLVNR